MKSFLLAVLIAAPAAAEAPEWDARIAGVEGKEAYIYPEGGGDGVPAEVGAPVEPGDRVSTGKRCRVEIALDPDSLLEMGASSTFVVEKPETGVFARFFLSAGSLMAKLQKFSVQRRTHIRTPTAVAAVRGTEFGLEVAEDGRTDVGVFDEGQVAVLPSEEGFSETLLGPGEETRIGTPGESSAVERDGGRYLAVRKLDRLKRGRERMKGLLSRLERVRAEWKSMGPAERLEFRGRLRERVKDLAPNDRKRIREFQEKRSDRLDRKREGVRNRRGPARQGARRPPPRRRP